MEKMCFFGSPNGSGKSLTFEIAPFVLSCLQDKTALPSVCCILVSPLVSLMRTHAFSTNKKSVPVGGRFKSL